MLDLGQTPQSEWIQHVCQSHFLHSSKECTILGQRWPYSWNWGWFSFRSPSQESSHRKFLYRHMLSVKDACTNIDVYHNPDQRHILPFRESDIQVNQLTWEISFSRSMDKASFCLSCWRCWFVKLCKHKVKTWETAEHLGGNIPLKTHLCSEKVNQTTSLGRTVKDPGFSFTRKCNTWIFVFSTHQLLESSKPLSFLEVKKQYLKPLAWSSMFVDELLTLCFRILRI